MVDSVWEKERSRAESLNGGGSVSAPAEEPAAAPVQLSLYQLDDPLLAEIRDILQKLDLNNMSPLDAFDTIKACVAYKYKGKEIKDFPYNIEHDIEPVYVELPGWKTDMTHFTSEEQFPKAFADYIQFLEKQLETPICIISIGPDREQTIVRK